MKFTNTSCICCDDHVMKKRLSCIFLKEILPWNMKCKLLCVCIGLIIGTSCMLSQADAPTCHPTNKDLEDSGIFVKIPKQPTLVYNVGSYALWSKISQDSTSYVFSSWKDMKTKPLAPFDTIRVIDTWRPIIKWGLDTLPTLSKEMQPIFLPSNVHQHLGLDVYDNGAITFTKEFDVMKYEGPNSEEFNKKLMKLSCLMLWLCLPDTEPRNDHLDMIEL